MSSSGATLLNNAWACLFRLIPLNSCRIWWVGIVRTDMVIFKASNAQILFHYGPRARWIMHMSIPEQEYPCWS